MIYKNYLYIIYIRWRIYYSKTPNDIKKIFKNISYFNNKINSDQLLEFLINCLTIYPLKDKELQKFSLWQQEFQNDLGLINYVTFMLWLSVIESLNIPRIK